MSLPTQGFAGSLRDKTRCLLWPEERICAGSPPRPHRACDNSNGPGLPPWALRAVRLSAGRAARRCSSNGRSLVHPSAIAAKLATWRSVCAADEVPRGIARTRFVEVPQPLPLPLVMGQSLDAASVFHQPTPSEGECRHPSARSRRAASPSAGQGPRGQAHLSQRPMQFRWLPQGNGLSTLGKTFPTI